MATTLSRRALLRGRIEGTSPARRPPWAVREQFFLTRCTRCDECIKGCPEKIIRKGGGGFPVVDFNHGECTFCGECVRHCTHGALSLTALQADEMPWKLHPTIAKNCLPLNRVVCRSCAEQCEPQAIRFPPAPGGVAHPEIHAMRCTGCGACVRPCPVGAITLVVTNSEQSTQQELSA